MTRLPSAGVSDVFVRINFFMSCGGQSGHDVPVEGAVELPPGGGQE
jgi:hypothetical protein